MVYRKQMKYYNRITLILCLLLFLGMICGIVQATEDSDEQTSTVTLTILPTSHLSIIDQAVSETLVQDSTAESAFDVGFVEFEPDKPTLVINANNNWKLTAKSSGFTGPYAKAITDLQLKDSGSVHVADGFGDYQTLSASDQEIAAYTKGVKGESHPCQYRILLDYTKDIPGTYEATVTYTLSTTGA